TYTLLVRPFAIGEWGSFHFTLTGEPAPSLDEGAQTMALSEKLTRDFLTFTGKANTTVLLIMDFTPGNLSSTYISVFQNGMSLAYADTYTYDDLSHVELVVEVPNNGIVGVSITDYSLQPVVAKVTLEEVQ
ncbi:MAG: hypothetical protein K8I82_17455, partial [Anaerolineae bacterium]|nr:hypothetical protein [Anaerolineae bacterium]